MSKSRDKSIRLSTSEEVADLLGVSIRHVRRLMKTGKLGFHRIGIRAVRFSEADLDKYLRATRGGRS